jgi:hypothetical protein
MFPKIHFNGNVAAREQGPEFRLVGVIVLTYFS